MEVGVPKFEPPGALAREFWIQWKSACVEPRGRVTGRKVLKKIRRENFEKIISKMSTNTGLNGGGGPQVRAPGCPSQGVLNPMKISVCRAEGKSNWQKSFKENSSGKFEKIISKMSTNTGLNGGGGPQVRAPGCPRQGVLNPMKISVCKAEGKSNWQKSFKENSSGKCWENYLQNVNKYGLKWRWGTQVRAPGCPSQGVLNPMKISVCKAEGKSNWQKSFKENSSGKCWENYLQNVNKYGLKWRRGSPSSSPRVP